MRHYAGSTTWFRSFGTSGVALSTQPAAAPDNNGHKTAPTGEIRKAASSATASDARDSIHVTLTE